MLPKGHGEGHPRPPPGRPERSPPTRTNPGDPTRDIPEDDLSLQIPGVAAKSKIVNRLEGARRCSPRNTARDTHRPRPGAPSAPRRRGPTPETRRGTFRRTISCPESRESRSTPRSSTGCRAPGDAPEGTRRGTPTAPARGPERPRRPGPLRGPDEGHSGGRSLAPNPGSRGQLQDRPRVGEGHREDSEGTRRRTSTASSPAPRRPRRRGVTPGDRTRDIPMDRRIRGFSTGVMFINGLKPINATLGQGPPTGAGGVGWRLRIAEPGLPP